MSTLKQLRPTLSTKRRLLKWKSPSVLSLGQRIFPMKTLMIGPYKYTITYTPETNRRFRGWCDNLKLMIGIRKGMKKDMKAEVLLHEILHAVIYTFGMAHWIKQKPDEHERMVWELSIALATVFKQNPKLLEMFKWNRPLSGPFSLVAIGTTFNFTLLDLLLFLTGHLLVLSLCLFCKPLLSFVILLDET